MDIFRPEIISLEVVALTIVRILALITCFNSSVIVLISSETIFFFLVYSNPEASRQIPLIEKLPGIKEN